MRVFRLDSAACLAALTLLLGACAQAPVKPASPAQAAATARTQIDYEGRFAIKYNDQNGAERNAYGNFTWHQEGETVSVELKSPLGQTLAVIESAPASATLEMPNRAPQTAPKVDDLMHDALGFALPVSNLRYWLEPAPAPGSKATTDTDPSNGRIKELKQDGWTVDYYEYAADNSVKRMNLVRTEPPIAIRIVLDH
ncbi:lipoprotein insertase outer membrane protein LolB [Pararobbsia silviterrae]|uniref:Outer-membrane lipoprotein LolB n=1 Tax=Pararobbsia silviterrae TaxID=1792498 RepID=A0A494Y7Z9_9BURK|nr:lipoprotein insertase outer membrane protein LolB [Pararobbsia silviterrae]RKP58831.1 outer membrane lipoprotein LolB [Pararobbsia silviterrae]